MDNESEPYVRLATLRSLNRIVADLNAACSAPARCRPWSRGR
jgi:hypothetical protein